MPAKKRATVANPEPNTGSDYTVCDPCRQRKVRCTREKPICSHCRRHGLLCEWEGLGKKPNQTFVLSNAVSALETRVGEVERALSALQGPSSPMTPTSRCHSQSKLLIRTRSADSPQSVRAGSAIQLDISSISGMKILPMSSNARDVTASTSALCQLFSQSVLNPLAEAQGIQAHKLQEAMQDLQKLDQVWPTFPVHDGSALSCPSPAVLEVMMGLYSNEVHPELPLFSLPRLHAQISQLRINNGITQDLAEIVCLNSMVLLTLAPRLSHPVSDAWTCARGGFDSELKNHLYQNALLAMRNLDALLVPSIANVQALVCLHLIALIYGSPCRPGDLLDQAIATARSAELQIWNPNSTSHHPDELEECRQVLRCLNILDKSACWMGTRSAKIPTHEVLTLMSIWKHAEEHLPVAVWERLTILEEAINHRFQSSSIFSDEPGTFSLGARIEAFLNETQSQVSALYLGLRSVAHAIHVLFCWPNCERRNLKVQLMQSARSCLSLIISGWSSSGFHHCALLVPKIIQYAPLSFFQMCTHVISNRKSTSPSDIDLLCSFHAVLKSIHGAVGDGNPEITRMVIVGDVVLDIMSSWAHIPPSSRQGGLIPVATVTPVSSEFSEWDLDHALADFDWNGALPGISHGQIGTVGSFREDEQSMEGPRNW